MERKISRVMEQTQVPLHLRQTVCEEMRHGIQVSNLARMIGEEMGQPLDFCQKLEVAGVVHDIGKLRLTQYLYADDGLMVEQMKYVRQHAAQSFQILQNTEIDEDIAWAVFHHHENYDGSGYPDNLRGGAIPLMSRVLRVCDVFIALITNRSYRKAFDAGTAMEIMIDEVKDYDMQVFLAFQRVIHRKGLMDGGGEIFNRASSERQVNTLSLFERELQLLLSL